MTLCRSNPGGNMNLRFVSSFVATADLGSFSKAAESLFSTQATIASRVARLEEELGVPLFFRDGSTLILTEHGHAALPLARRLLNSAREFVQAAGGTDDAEGIFRIAWTDYVSFLLQPAFLAEASARYPRLSFEFFTHSSMDVLDRLHDGRVDIGVLVGVEAKPNLISRHLFDLPLRWICKADIIAPDRQNLLSALQDVPLIAYPVGTLPSQAVDAQLENAGLRVPKTYWLDTLHAVLAAVREGLGTALIPPALVQQDIDAGRLVVLEMPVPIDALPFHAQFRRNARIEVCNALCELMSNLAANAVSDADDT